MEENKTIEKMLDHRSIRKWKEEPIGEELVNKLLEVANRTSTSNGLLQSLIIRITDQKKKE